MPNDNRDFKNRKQEIGLIVLTYSVTTDKGVTLATLNDNGASIHYLLEENGRQTYKLDQSNQVSFCCGKSEFRGKSSVNEFSINIMLMNDSESPFKQAQIDKLISTLGKIKEAFPHLDLKIDIAGLGEVAVQKDSPSPRHIAPGKFFPWEQLAQHGFGLFLSTTPEQKAEVCISPESSEPEILALQTKLKEYGYAIASNGVYDDATKAWVTRFNQRYVPDSTQQIDASIWSKASQLSLEYIQNYKNELKQAITQTTASAPSLFKVPSNSDIQSTDTVDAEQKSSAPSAKLGIH
jgi:N-acetyl-anhydromuramyl-L-alanine amidase AmpD